MTIGVPRSGRHLGGGLAQRLADLALEAADAGLAGVAVDDLAERRVGHLDLALAQAVALRWRSKRWSRAMATFSSSV